MVAMLVAMDSSPWKKNWGVSKCPWVYDDEMAVAVLIILWADIALSFRGLLDQGKLQCLFKLSLTP